MRPTPSDDLLHYRRSTDLGSFAIVSRDIAAGLLIALAAFSLLFWPELLAGSVCK